MVGVKTGIDYGDKAACSGIVGPNLGSAGHTGGYGLIWLVRSLGGSGLVSRLDINVLNALNALYGVDRAIGHVRGDEVRDKGEVPDNVKLLSLEGLAADSLDHALLLCAESVAVGHRGFVLGDLLGGEHLDSGLFVENDRYANYVAVLIQRLFRRLFLGSIRKKPSCVLYLFPSKARLLSRLFIGHRGNGDKSDYHDERQQN